jgi:hypothetical protein
MKKKKWTAKIIIMKILKTTSLKSDFKFKKKKWKDVREFGSSKDSNQIKTLLDLLQTH